MKLRKLIYVCFILMFLTSCNVDYLNINDETSKINISSSEVFNIITEGLSLPNFRGLNESELLDLYAIDPKILIDYIANVPHDYLSSYEISVFRVKDREYIGEVTLGIERRISELQKEFNTLKQTDYNLIKNPYIRVFDNYVVFALYEDIDALERNLNKLLN